MTPDVLSDSAGYNIVAIRNLVREAFTAADLRRFCHDRPAFQFVLTRFGPGFSFEDMIETIIEQCEKQALFPDLLAAIREHSPRQYERHCGQLVAISSRQRVVNLRPLDMRHTFKDRQREIKAFRDCLADDRVRLVSVVGRGGIGKTAFVSYVLADLEEGSLTIPVGQKKLPVDGILYLGARTTGLSLERIYADVGRMLGKPAASRLSARWAYGEASLAARVEYLLEALRDGSYLIVLDNLEDTLAEDGSILDAGLRLFVERCLARPSGARLITTSREQVRFFEAPRQAIHTIPLLEGLPEEDAAELLRDLDPLGELELRDGATDDLRQAARRTEGIPRALELLAGILDRDPTASLSRLLADERLFGAQVVERLVEEGYRRLDNDERRAMEALAIFDRPTVEPAVAYLLHPWFPDLDVGKSLRHLVDSYFAVANRNTGEYSLHPLDRDYAHSRLPVGDKAGAYTRRNLELRAANYYATIRKPGKWETIEDLQPQLLEFEHCVRAGDYDRAGFLLESIDFDYLSMWGHAGKLVDLREQLLGRLTQPGLIANNLGNLGLSYHALGRVRQALACFQQAAALAGEIQERASEGLWLGDLGSAYRDLGQGGKAIEFYEQALAIARETGDRKREGVWLGDLGSVYHDLGRFEEAIGFFEKSLAIHQQVGDRRRTGAETGNLGSVYRALGYFDKAIELYSEALRIARLVGDRWSEGANLGQLGVAYRHLGKIDQAIECHQAARANARAIGHRRVAGRQLGYLGDIYRLLGQAEPAIQFLNEALDIARATDDRRFEGVWLHRLSALQFDLGQIERAVATQRQALEVTREIGDDRGVGYRLLALGRFLLIGGETVEAETCLLEAQRLEALEPHARILLALGIARLPRDSVSAQQEFTASASLSSTMLERTSSLYEARFSLAAALAGLATYDPQWTETEKRQALLAPALREYRQALDTCSAPGVVQDALRDLEMIRSAGIEGLEPVFELLQAHMGAEVNAT